MSISLKENTKLTQNSDKTIYVEIFNNNIDESDVFDHLLIKIGATITKKLSKIVDYIIYKDGRLKTIKYAMDNNIPLVNPLWLHDKLNNIYEPDEKYLIKKTFTELTIEDANTKPSRKTKSPNENKKRKKLSINKNNYNVFLSSKKDKVKSMQTNCKVTSFLMLGAKTQKEKEEIKKIKVFSYGLTENQIDFLRGIKEIDYEVDVYNDEDKYYQQTKIVFIKNTFDKRDWKIISFFLQEKLVANIGMFINNTFNKDNPITFRSFEEVKFPDYYSKINPSRLNILTQNVNKDNFKSENDIYYYISENLPKNEYDICKIILTEMFNQKLHKQNTISAMFSLKKEKNTQIDENCPNPDKINKEHKTIYKISNVPSYINFDPLTSKNKKIASSLVYTLTLSINYIYDSFYQGSLIELNEKNKKVYSL